MSSPADASRSLLLTLGDPNGLGPELAVQLLSRHGRREPKQPLLMIGPEQALSLHLKQAGQERFWLPLADPSQLRECDPGLYLHSPPDLDGFSPKPGQADPEGGRAAGVSLDLACDLLTHGLAQGVVTCPLNKAMLMAAGFDFPGHTEFLAERAGLAQDEVCMHLCGDILRVSLVTTHPPLKDVPGLITRERVLRALRLTHAHVRQLGLQGPVAVCGLNPHAGESGKIGCEEIEVIIPAVQEALEQGIEAAGPFPADTVFHRAIQGEFSAVLAMYHDQGLGPLKLLHFGNAVNVTLGLPFVRTSVDHGTGYDIVGKGVAHVDSLAAALDLAARLLDNQGVAAGTAAHATRE
ncbi:MAG: 4-hydroxythreonine-4-phosphate dehydrogenase PdxA [Desulfovibrio sp.]|nr:MAG: 4-hydroxythreonine-4-phosphate dehydrogenase PdxA [Desulfovibrio sp.]